MFQIVMQERVWHDNGFVSAPDQGEEQYLHWDPLTKTGFVVRPEATAPGVLGGYFVEEHQCGQVVARRCLFDYTAAMKLVEQRRKLS